MNQELTLGAFTQVQDEKWVSEKNTAVLRTFPGQD